MKEIIVKNIINKNEIKLDFYADKVPSPPIIIDINGDVDLNSLVNELVKSIEFKRMLSFEFIDEDNLAESNNKIKLIKETLKEIYLKFNENIESLREIEKDMN